MAEKPRPYDADLAAQIAEKFGVDEVTVRVWKTRKQIPGKYFDPNFDTSEKLSDNDQDYQKIKQILNMPEIAKSKFRGLENKGADVSRGKDRMTTEEKTTFLTEITELRNELRLGYQTLTMSQLKKVLGDVRIHGTKLVGTKLYNLVMDDRGRRMLTESEKNEIKVSLLSLYNKIRIK